MIDEKIPLLGAEELVVDHAHWLGNPPDVLPHLIICSLYSQATLILPNPHDIWGPLANSYIRISGRDVDK